MSIGLNASVGARGINYTALAAYLFSLGLIADFDATKLPLSGTTPVSSWTDTFGAYTGTQTGSNRPNYVSNGWSDGGPAVLFSQASTQCLNCDPLAAVTSNGGAYTIVAIVRMTSVAADAFLFGVSTGLTTPYRYHGIQGGNSGSPQIAANLCNPGACPQNSQGTYTFSAANGFTNEDSVIIISCNGQQSFVMLNGQLIPGAIGSQDAATVYTKAVIGGLNYNGAPHPSSFSGTMRRFLVYNRGFSLRDTAAVHYTLGLQSELRFTLVCSGDSITQGNFAGPPWCNTLAMPTYAITANTISGFVQAQSAVVNLGSSGRSLGYNAFALTNNEQYHALADAQNTYLPTIAQILVLFMGTNDDYYGGGLLTAPQWVNLFTGVVGQFRAAAPHSYIVGATMLPRGNWSLAANYIGTDAPYNATLAAANKAMLGTYQAMGLDAVWDAGSCPGLQVPGTPAAPGPNYVDACHPTTAGQALLGATFPIDLYRRAAVNKLLRLQLAA